tara:strand:- start:116 stop:334 length:219 start_codon:yes stop_codon:yes gene_type:complete
MLVTNLEDMENIVRSNKDLSWDGWDVVKYKKNMLSQFNKSGSLRNGQWYSRSSFPLTESGWSIPNSLGGKDV